MGVKCSVNDDLEIHCSRITSRQGLIVCTTQLAQLHNEELRSLCLRCEKDLFSCWHSSLGLRGKLRLKRRRTKWLKTMLERWTRFYGRSHLTILISVHGQTALIRTLRGHIARRVLRINGASVLNRLNLEKM